MKAKIHLVQSMKAKDPSCEDPSCEDPSCDKNPSKPFNQVLSRSFGFRPLCTSSAPVIPIVHSELVVPKENAHVTHVGFPGMAIVCN